MNVALPNPTMAQQAVGHTVRDTTGATQASPAAAQANATASGPGSTVISSTDFLSLLVAEMKNQDPTQPTDPNQYIQQLVGVNSLQQLISINSELGGASAGQASTTTQGTPAA